MTGHLTFVKTDFEKAISPPNIRRFWRAVEFVAIVWRTPVRESKEVLHRVTYRREWMPERNCWRYTLVNQERVN